MIAASMTNSLLVIILLISFIVSAFFAASEASLIALNKVRLRHMMEKKRKGAFRVYRLASQMDRLIATILLGNNLVNAIIAGIITVLCTRYFGDEGISLFFATLITTVIIVIFTELTPKVLATNHPEGTAFL